MGMRICIKIPFAPLRYRAGVILDNATSVDLDNILPSPNNALFNSQYGGDKYEDRTLALILRWIIDCSDHHFITRYPQHMVTKVVSLTRKILMAPWSWFRGH